MKRVAGWCVVLGLSLGLGGAGIAEEAKAPAKKPAAKSGWKFLPAADVKFAETEGVNGSQSATLWGDMKKGAYGAFVKWPAGFETPWHIHSHPIRAVVVQGTFTAEVKGQAVRELGPGSYLYDPGHSSHKSGCKAGGGECVFLITQSAAFDIIPDEKK